MSYLHDYMGLLGCLLFLIAVPLTALKQPCFKRKTVTIAIFLMMGLAVVPINELSVLAYIRAVLADLSITSMILLCAMIASAYTGQRFIKTSSRHQLENSVLIAALILYPLGLGLTPYDTYAAGYGSLTMLGMLVLVAGYLLWREAYFVLTLLLIAICAYLAGMLQSSNLWDYMIDPWLVILVITTKIRLRVKQATGRTTIQ
ncbi:MAG: hypothetical protein OQL16_08330 [Gammaproteobacteria bacterium]|nr:hypothetical protein [Gammaproteobacteria bacterium]